MNSKTLRNFIEIADTGSLTAASKKLFIAQPALSNQLKALEKELDTVLIDRNSRHLKLTDTGLIFYERAKKILMQENALHQEIHDSENGNVGCLRIATIQSGEINLLERIIPMFSQKYPLVTYEIHEKESDDILQMLTDGIAEIGVISTPAALTEDMEAVFISDEKLVCAYDPDVFSFGNKSSISLSELENLPLLIIRRYEERFLTLCNSAHFHPAIRAVNKQLTINLKWAEAGLGVAIVPENSLSYCKKPLRFCSIEECDLTIKRAIITMKDNYHSQVVKNFISLCKTAL
ncbi:MAG: LysR family transcriptional regulator [Clostridia bacterium]|nr:LysR family transcriptional regulator [Clostridia bacterium]